jgi:hypothetical protein
MDSGISVRKIVHIDMDGFYASVEQRDDPQLRANPWWSRGAANAPSSAPLPMKQGDWACGRQCQQSEPSTKDSIRRCTASYF